ncbi:MAG: sugar ABC transporter ATP-binding protein [Phycisphaerae bacterium]|nr:sugar ABC transporter ATP-binding protein [Phycisphaerae bacterium]
MDAVATKPSIAAAGSRAILEVRGVTKRFPGVTALDDVSLAVELGACHALCGENGAGKSTLGRIIAGILTPDAGELRIDGRPVRIRSPLDAARAGIGLVHQELHFCPNLSVAENLLLGGMPRRGPWLARAALREAARQSLASIGAEIDPDTPMERLSIAQEQLVQIAAATRVGARLLVLDEPTSSLSEHEAARLFELMRELRRRGVTLIYVTHRLGEVFSQCDAVSVLRDGRHVVALPTAATTPDEVVRHMIGRPLNQYLPVHAASARGAVRLTVQSLSSPGRFEGIGFELHAGEILGLAGLVGAGRSEIAHVLFGLDRAATGAVRINGTSGFPRHPAEALNRGLGYLPEDRKRQGLVLSLGGRENLSLAILRRLSRAGFVRRRRERALTREYFDRLAVRAPDIDAPTSGLSGGNQQKVALAKWLAAQCPVLIVDEPTRGVDVGAKAEIHALLDRLALEGAAILLISSELPELLALSTRLIVLREGRMVGELDRSAATQERVMRMMAGVGE